MGTVENSKQAGFCWIPHLSDGLDYVIPDYKESKQA